MKLNKLEFYFMKSFVRKFLMRCFEIRRIRKFSKLGPGKIGLEIGCGPGTSIKLLMSKFRMKKLYATDIDQRMIDIAKKNYGGGSILFEVQDASKLKYGDKFFDVVFGITIIHHVPNWHICLDELFRVLKSGGQLIIEDLSIETFSGVIGGLMRKYLRHPYKTMFKYDELVGYLQDIGFKVLVKKKYFFPIKHFIIIAVK